MTTMYSLSHTLPCGSLRTAQETDISAAIRVSTVALGAIVILIGALSLTGVAGFAHLEGAIGMTCVGSLFSLTGIFLRCVKTTSHVAHQPRDLSSLTHSTPRDNRALLPDDMIKLVLSKLDLHSLARSSGVCRQWRTLAHTPELMEDILRRTPQISIFGEEEWRRHFDLPDGISFGDAPSFNAEVLHRLARHAALPIEDDAGITLLTLPEGLTFNKLVELAGAPRQGEAAKFQYIWDDFQTAYGDEVVTKTYRIAITNNVLEESRRKSVAEQKALVGRFVTRMPKTLEAATLCIVTFISAYPKQPFGDEPWTYTRCEENINGYQMLVGGFSPAGLRVDCITYFGNARNGVGAVSEVP